MAASGEDSPYDSPSCLDHKMLQIEAEEAIKEVKFAVKDAHMSSRLACTKELVYFNLVTKEGHKYCVELTAQGFRVAARKHDTINVEHSSNYFETIYALLDHLSPEYQRSFGSALMNKLVKLQNSHQVDGD